MPLVRPQEQPSFIYFTLNNILFFDGTKIYPQNKLFQSAISEYLDVIASHKGEESAIGKAAEAAKSAQIAVQTPKPEEAEHEGICKWNLTHGPEA